MGDSDDRDADHPDPRALRPEANARSGLPPLLPRLTCPMPSADVHCRSLVSVAVVTHLVTHPRSGLHGRPKLDACPSPIQCHAGCRNAAVRCGVWPRECRWPQDLHRSSAISIRRARGLRMPTSANATGIQRKITPLMCQGKSARAAAARSRPSSLPAAAVKRTGRTTSAPSLRTNPEFAWPGPGELARPSPGLVLTSPRVTVSSPSLPLYRARARFGEHQIRRSGHIVQGRPPLAAGWADIPKSPIRVQCCPAAWQQYWQQSRRL
jgi:hypothetical protein